MREAFRQKSEETHRARRPPGLVATLWRQSQVCRGTCQPHRPMPAGDATSWGRREEYTSPASPTQEWKCDFQRAKVGIGSAPAEMLFRLLNCLPVGDYSASKW